MRNYKHESETRIFFHLKVPLFGRRRIYLDSVFDLELKFPDIPRDGFNAIGNAFSLRVSVHLLNYKKRKLIKHKIYF